ncbi:MAG: histidine phosphatase family protein [Rhodospirillales bacterium]|nr:histidine phosphatase family protein [Rhodospirillales bacterium]
MSDPAAGLAPIPFWYLRHGETDWNAQGLSQGNVDIPLNPTGVAQAHVAAGLLRHRGIGSIVVSPLSRARDTAALAAVALGLSVTVQDDLREVSFGVQEGKPMSAWFDDWVAGRYTPEGAESFVQLTARTVAAVNQALTHTPAVLIVAHGAVFRALRGAMGLPPNERTRNAWPILCQPPAPGSAAWTLHPVPEA